jgi:hypothetical protein
LFDEARRQFQRCAVERSSKVVAAALLVDLDGDVSTIGRFLELEQAEIHEAEHENVTVCECEADVGRQRQAVGIHAEWAGIVHSAAAAGEHGASPFVMADRGKSILPRCLVQLPVPDRDQVITLAEWGDRDLQRAAAGPLDAVSQRVRMAPGLADLQCDAGLSRLIVHGVAVGEVACRGPRALLLAPVPTAHGPPGWRRPVLALNDRDGVRGDSDDVAHSDQVGEVRDHGDDAIARDPPGDVEHKVETGTPCPAKVAGLRPSRASSRIVCRLSSLPARASPISSSRCACHRASGSRSVSATRSSSASIFWNAIAESGLSTASSWPRRRSRTSSKDIGPTFPCSADVQASRRRDVRGGPHDLSSEAPHSRSGDLIGGSTGGHADGHDAGPS